MEVIVKKKVQELQPDDIIIINDSISRIDNITRGLNHIHSNIYKLYYGLLYTIVSNSSDPVELCNNHVSFPVDTEVSCI